MENRIVLVDQREFHNPIRLYLPGLFKKKLI